MIAVKQYLKSASLSRRSFSKAPKTTKRNYPALIIGGFVGLASIGTMYVFYKFANINSRFLAGAVSL